MSNQLLADGLHKPIIKKPPLFRDNIWGVNLADMQLLSKYNKGINFLLCVIDIFNKYAWVSHLKDGNIEKLLPENVLLIGLKFLELKKNKKKHCNWHMLLLISIENKLFELFMISFNLNFV